MNWLAHLYLSEPNAEFRVGNLLPDLTTASHLKFLPEPYQRGIRCHRRIDVFTDSHPRVRSSVWRFPPPYRRFGGILTDVYFDYFLARDWGEYSTVPLAEFIGEFYRDIETCSAAIPAEAKQGLQRMRNEDWLGRYHHLEGVTDILGRIGRRFRRPLNLMDSLPIFQEHESAFLEDFHNFFPELRAHVR
ncbi:MAG TPA: ACP phosphodiesterase [Candidatus Sulfotelmatobacter sp.]|nr:ACP phosphodiesterase [Candidatus Sulfotelmatobacter sp.]